ncbi:uncharacterized protein LOC123537525 isoform X2 [Mercenaria mercenaria]|nr:uncharacterized protein LOC123537525 isoform X2 [Mercenaria mercenaria]
MESASDSDFDSDDSIDFLSEYTDIDVNGFLGRAIAIWTYNRLDNLTLFTPQPDDTLFQLVKYAEQKLKFNRENEKIMVMDAGEKLPREMKDVYLLKPGSVIMVLPKRNLNITVEINQLNKRFPISADPMCTVYDVKTYIKRVKGIPIDQQDILYRDKVLENSRRLYEFRVRNGTNMHVLIQVYFDVIVHVETFWGKTYRLYVDKCSTGSDLIYRVFGRTFSKHGKEHVTMHELYVPIHVLVFQHNKRSLNWNYCLGFYGVRNADTLVLNTVGRHSDMNVQTIMVVTELGESYEVRVSQFDRWSVVAFILHGHTDVPVDLIRLYRNESQLNFTASIGFVPKNTVIMMNIIMTNVDKDMMFGIPLKITIGNGIVENIKVSPTKTIKYVKERLEEIGIPNATLSELTTGQFKLPDHAKIKDVITNFDKMLYLKVERFPVFIHAPDGTIYRTMVDVNHTLKNLKQKIELKSGHAISSCRLLFAGQELTIADNNILYDSGFSTRNSIFVETAQMFETFFVTNGDLLIKLRVPARPTQDNIKRSIWGTRDIPEGSITCLQTFLFWFFAPRRNRKFTLPRRRRNRKRIPPSNEPLHLFSDRYGTKFDEKNVSDLMLELNHKRGDHFKPLVYPDELAEDGKTHRTWPISLQRPVRPRRNVEDWINATYYEPRFNRKHTRTPTRKKSLRSAKKQPEHQQELKPYVVNHHIQPRWLNNLYEKEEHHGLSVADDTGLAYRHNPKQGQTTFYTKKQRRKAVRTPTHHQGDASLSKYLHHKRQMFDNQELAYLSSDDEKTEVFDELSIERPYIILR